MEFGSFIQTCGKASEAAAQTQRTKPLIPEMCFTTTGCSTDINLSTPYLEEDGTSMLVSCKKCSVRVHASEYLSPFLLLSQPACWKLLSPVGLSSVLQRRMLMYSWEVGDWWMDEFPCGFRIHPKCLSTLESLGLVPGYLLGRCASEYSL